MARENTITLVGEVSKNPTVAVFKDIGTYKLAFNMQCLRRNDRVDEPRILVHGLDEETAQHLFQTIRKGAYVLVRGGVATSMKPKSIRCPRCGAEEVVNTLFTDVNAYAPPVLLNGKYDMETLREVANSIHLIGAVCTEVQNRCSTNGTSMTQYQIAVNRKFHVKEQAEKTDYPWVKSFGQQADEDAKHLHVGSQIYINGAFQTREVTRSITCSECGEQLSYQEIVGEIVPYDVEYLANCTFDEREDGNGDKSENPAES